MLSLRKHLAEWRKIAKEKKDKKILEKLSTLHPSDIADYLEHLKEKDRVYVFHLLDHETASEVLTHLGEPVLHELLEDKEMKTKEIAEIIEEMDSDDATDIVSELDKRKAEGVLHQLEKIDKEESEEVKELLKHKEDTAGGLMQTEFIGVRDTDTVKEAIKEIRRRGREIETVHNVFVVNKNNKLVGVLSLRRLIISDMDEKIKKIMNPKVVSVNVKTDQEHVAAIFKKHDYVSIPVVDENKKLLGRITFDDIVDVIEEESTEDFYKMAGLDEDEHVLDRPTISFKKRVPWLLFNLITALVAAAVVNHFAGTIASFVVIVVFMPMVAGMAGNAATQALTLTVRGLAVGELTGANLKAVLRKQITTGVMLGATIGAIMGVFSYVWKGNIMLSILIFAAIMLNILLGVLWGTLIPLLFKWLKKDPALASGVFITGLTDTIGFLIFLGFTTMFIVYLV